MRSGETIVLVEDEKADAVGMEGFPIEMADVGDLDMGDDEGWSEDDGEDGYYA